VLWLSNLARAESTFGHWTTGVVTNNAGVYAATINDSGAILGEYCYFSSKSCTWTLGVDLSCDKDHSYPVLANTDKGAAYFDIVCVGRQENGLYSFGFKNWQDLELLLKSGARIGIATPMQSDQFKVYRFLLDGLTQSTKSIEEPFFAAVASPKSKPVEPTKSTVTSTL
jgi:hypothetical protein